MSKMQQLQNAEFATSPVKVGCQSQAVKLPTRVLSNGRARRSTSMLGDVLLPGFHTFRSLKDSAPYRTAVVSLSASCTWTVCSEVVKLSGMC